MNPVDSLPNGNMFSPNHLLDQPLAEARATVCQYLKGFAASSEFMSKMSVAFGERFSSQVALRLAQAWQQEDFNVIPAIEFLTSSELNGANGAYAASTNTIYLSQEFVEQQDLGAIVNLLLEEIGHRIDQLLNTQDSAGDEGAIFSVLVRGEELTGDWLQQLKAEDDAGVISLNGQLIAIENQTFTGDAGNNTINGTSEDDLIDGQGGNDTLNGLAGDDTLIGREGNDVLDGGSGNDVLEGGSGINTLRGGDGNDLLVNSFGSADGGTDNDVLVANFSGYGAGVYNTGFNDRFRRVSDNADLIYYYNIEHFNITGTEHTDYFRGEAGDTLDGAGGKDYLHLDFALQTDSVTVNLIQSNDQVIFIDTVVENFESIGIISTGSGSDSITLGLAGSTDRGTIDGNGGTDTLSLNFSGYGAGVYNTGLNDRFRRVSDNADLVYYADIEHFHVTGTGHTDYLRGNLGDTLDGGAGKDFLSLDLSNVDSSVQIDLTLSSNQVSAPATEVRNFESIEQIITGSGDDSISLGLAGSTDRGTIDGNGGTDTLSLNFSGYGAGVYNTGLNDRFRRVSDNADLVYYADIEHFHVTGSTQADVLQGFAGNDTLIGGAGNDNINGGAGSDIIVGVNPNSATPGLNEIDTLAGGAGADRFILGNAATAFYDDGNATTAGTGDYARITDFNPNEDTIQLKGPKSNYRLGTSPVSGITGTAIFLDKPGTEPDELIAIIEGVTGLDLNSNAFIEARDEIAFADAQFSVNENGTPVVAATVIRTANNAREASATIVLGDGTATAGVDYNNTPIEVRFAAGETSKTITVPITDDSLVEGNETISLTLIDPTGGATLGTQNTATLTIVDNENAGTLAFSNSAYSIREDGTSAVAVTITRTGGSDGNVSGTVYLNNGTAAAPSDYDNSPIVVNFADGETTPKTVTIPIVNDTKFEADETINLSLGSATNGATIGTQNTAVLTILNDDVAVPGTFAFSRSEYSVNEDGTPVLAVTIERTSGSDGTVAVTLTPSNGTAIAPGDYNNAPITVNFADGETSKTVAIPIVDDAIFEPNETIALTLSDPTNGATLGTQTTATLTILNNDAPQQGFLAFSNPTYSVNEDGTAIAVVTVTRTGGSDGAVSADVVLSDGTAKATDGDYSTTPLTVTFADGDTTAKTVTIPITNDTLVESTETLNLTLANPTGGASLGSETTAVLAILDDDTQLNFSAANYTVREDGTAVTNIIVTRTGQTIGAVSATIAFTDGTAKGCTCAASSVNNDFYNGSFTFTLADGETSKIIPVEAASLGGSNAIRIRDDVKVEGDEFFTINLINPTGGATIGSQGSANVTILDDDVELAFSAPTFSIRENGEAIATVTVTRTGRSTGVVGATLNLGGGTASFPDDYAQNAIDFTLEAGVTSQVIQIPIRNDIVVEPDETVTLTLSNPTGGAAIGTQNSATLTIVDNGSAPALAVTLNKDLVAENVGNNAAIGTVTRNLVTDQDLVVTLTSSDTSEATVPVQVTILANQASATFDLNAIDDGIADGIQTVTITAAATGFSNGTDTILVSDINTPDLTVSRLTADTPLLSGKQASFSYRVENQGLATASLPLPTDRIVDRIYLSTDNKLDSSDTLLSEQSIAAEIPVGQFYERNVPFFVPRTPGQYYLIATTDATNVINEGSGLGDSNNTIVTPVTITPAYRAVVSTETEMGLAGSPVTLRGQALSNADNAPIPFEFVTIAVKNNGFVRELTAFTDASGNFVKAFSPLPNEGGTYQVNAYFPNNPGEDAAAEDGFKLLGMRFNTNSVSHKVIADQAFTAQVNLQNLADVNLNGITYTVEGAPENWNVQVTAPTTLTGSGVSSIGYTISAPNDSVITQDTFNIKLTSAEGVTAILPVSVDLTRITPQLTANTTLLSSGMLRGDQTFVEFEVTNAGGATAEDIQVVLPDAPWLKLASPTTIDALAPGESTKVTLRLAPDAELPLTAYQGNILLDAAGNDGDLSLPFNFRATSDAVGEVRISAVNELFYFTEAAPKLANATVTLRDALTGEAVVTAVTDQTGMITLSNIQEGFYNIEVRADDHDTFRQTIKLDAGEIENVDAFLSKQTVKYIWNVTPTEIQDKYNISIESVFETDVPIPTVVIDPPLIDLEDLQVVGQVMQIDMTLTNHGLIAANGLKLNIGDHPFYKIEPLTDEVGTLSAKSSITVPVRITRIADFDTLSSSSGEFSAQATPSVDCKISLDWDYYYECAGEQIKRAIPLPVLNVEGNCPPPSPSDFYTGPGGPGGPGRGGGSVRGVPVTFNVQDCDPCVEKNKQAVACLLIGAAGCIPGPIGCTVTVLSCAIGFGDGEGDWQDWTGCLTGLVGCVWTPACTVSVALCLDDFCLSNGIGSSSSDPFGGDGSLGGSGASSKFSISSTSSLNQGIAQLAAYRDRWQTIINAYKTFFGDDVWLKVQDDTVFNNWFNAFLLKTQGATAAEAKITATERIELLGLPIPAPITGGDIEKFIARWNRTVDYWEAGIFNVADVPSGQSQDFLAIDQLRIARDMLVTANEQAQAEGYNDLLDGLNKTALEVQQALEGNGDGVCAQVRIRIDQDAVMTRSAFLADLEIENGNSTSLQNLTVNLQVKDAQGNVVNNLFGITNPILKNITAVDGTGILSGDDPNTPQDEGIGSAQWTFIPTNLAAPDVPTQYSIGGTLSYVENGQTVTVPLLSTPVTVYPQAELYLDYFQQRNVYADDPFTDPIEPSVPFSLGVLVRNEGKGTAKDLSITSAQPKIIENEKGLLIDFQIIGSQVNGNDVSPSLTVDFGDIKAGETAVADWLLKSSLQGKFIEYNATFTHVNDLGNPELSLIKEVNIRELTRKVRVNHPSDDGLSDFLVNDVSDANFYPDTLYFSNGGTAPVSTVTTAITDGTASITDLQVQVTATTEAGWSYVRLTDPANGQFLIKSILQADGTEIPIDNVWRTDRTFPNEGRPTYENILHFLDHNPTAGSQTYTIVYTTGDQTAPKVREIVDVDPNPRNTPITSIDVVFTEAIRPETFDYTDLSLTLDGSTNLITNAVTLTQIDPITYRINNLTGITGNVGQYQLSVNASGIQDLEGLSGVGTVNENWIFTGDRPAVASITGFPGNQLNAPFDAIEVTFTEAINSSSFDFNDLFINRDQGGNLTNNTVTITQINDTTYRIANLSGLTSTDGNYLLLVNASGVTDTDGNTGIGAKGFNWTLDTDAPQITAITDVTSPRNTKVSSLDISFSNPINSATFDLSDLILTLDGSTNLITSSASLTQLTDTRYRLNGLTSLQASDGTYTLAVVGSGIQDAAGNSITNTRSESWTLDTLAPAVAIDLKANGNSINGAGQVRVNSTTVQLTGSLSETGLSVYFRDKVLNQTLGQATLTGTTFNGTVQLASPGARELEIQVVDAAGNSTTTPLSLFADLTQPPVITPGVTIAQTNGSTTVTEGGATDTYTIVLTTQPTANVTLTINTGNQISANQATLIFTAANWNTPQTVTVTANNDTTPEGTQTATISHTIASTDPNYNGLTLPNLSVTIADNDAEIRGIKWHDVNGDGIKDTNETGLANWTIYLDTNTNGQLDSGEQSTVTDAAGNYSFTDLRPGTYTVAEVMQAGWQQTFPRIEVTTTASNTQLYTPSLSETLNTTATTASQLVNLDVFRNDTRFTGMDGRGFAAVVIDTGIDLNHPFFGADADGDGVADRIVYQYDFADNDADASDRNGHGSHVASIIGSENSTYTGIASRADIIALKVFKDNGSGFFSDLEESLQWVIANANTYNIASVNLSLGDERNWNTDAARYGIGDELATLAAKGIIVTAAAGNNFAQFGSAQGLAYPAADPNTIAVGAVWSNSDQIADFSQRHKDLLEVFAPGIPIVGANANGGTQTLGGTSQASPHLAGIAVLAQQIAVEKLGRRLTVEEFRTLLNTTSDLINDGDDEADSVTNTGLNFPRVNLLALADGILKLNHQTPTQGTGSSTTNSSNAPLYLPNQSTSAAHTVTLTAGQVTTGINFGNQRLAVPGVLTFGATEFSIQEDGTPIAAVTLNRTGGSDGAVSATLNLTNNTATSPADYVNTPITVDFTDGETTKTVTIPVINDSLAEGNETITLTLTAPTGGATIGAQNTATLTIVDNEISLAFSDAQFSVNENGIPIAAVTVNRTGNSAGIVGARLTLRNGSAAASNDYVNIPIDIQFAAGEISKIVTIPIIDDILAEGNETIRLSLSNPTGGATIGSQSTATLAVVDNDVQLIFSSTPFGVREDGTAVAAVAVRRLGLTTGEVSATIVAADGTAIAPDDYDNNPIEVRFNAGETLKTVFVPIEDDALAEVDETIELELRNPTGGATIGAQGTATLIVLDNDATSSHSTLIGNDRVNKLTGTAAIDTLFGGTGNDTLSGGAGNDILDGGTGNDYLDGETGDDTLRGGTGNDTYIVDSGNDQVLEAPDAGTDTVRSSLNWTLSAHLEHLFLIDSAIQGTGNAFNNTLTGNDSNNILFGKEGNDLIKGGGGDDSLDGGVGDDTLDGGLGIDTMNGGSGKDVYVVDHENDQINEDDDGDRDTVRAALSWVLNENLENLTLIEGAIEGTGNALNNVISGNGVDNIFFGRGGDDTLKGNAGDDIIYGEAGYDTLDGGIGRDVMDGGSGNDIYVVDHLNDQILEEADAGNDTVRASINYTLGSHLENLTLTGTNQINGTGNALNNSISGNRSANTLLGESGNDTLSGGQGDDILIGGFGNDRLVGGDNRDQFVYSSFNEGGDTITDFNATQDALVLGSLFQGLGYSGSTPIEAGYLRLAQVKTNTQIQIDLDGVGNASTFKTLVTLNNVVATDLSSSNFVV